MASAASWLTCSGRSTTWPRASTMVTVFCVTSAQSPSSRWIMRRVTCSSAAVSEAAKFSPSPTPRSSGAPSRRLERVSPGAEMRIHALRDHLGGGIGGERITQVLQPLAHLLVVLDDAVMRHRDAAAHVRVGIALGGHAVRRPARMADADV